MSKVKNTGRKVVAVLLFLAMIGAVIGPISLFVTASNQNAAVAETGE